MFLKLRTRKKDGKVHHYYSVCESLRVHGGRTVQRQLFHLGELSSAQRDAWERTIETLHEDGSRRQLRFCADADRDLADTGEDVVEVKLKTMSVHRPRRWGDCWAGCKLWEELGLRRFWEDRLGEDEGAVPWHKVLELLSVNRLLAPRSELYIHEKWFAQTAMDLLLDGDERLAAKDRLYRCLDRITEHKQALEEHLAGRWKDLFNASFDLLLYDLTSTYFEGEAAEVPKARRGYSRDHRPDCLQVVLALVVTPEGFPLSYEVFPGNQLDVTTLEAVIESVEAKYGKARRLWVFDRGIVSEDNLALLRERGAHYLVGTPKRKLKDYEQHLVEGTWARASGEVEVQLVPESDEVYVLCRSVGRQQKERAMRRRWLKALVRDLFALRRRVRSGKLKQPDLIQMQLGRLSERHPQAWRWIASIEAAHGTIRWEWARELFGRAVLSEGAYLLRAHWTERDPAKLWQTYVQLAEAEAAFRTMKSEVKLRPIWHYKAQRVEAHILVAFLGYCLWVCLKKRAEHAAPGLTPWQILDQLGRIILVDVEFQLRDGRWLCLPRITQPEEPQALLLAQLRWQLPVQPPPRIRAHQLSNLQD